MKRASINLNNPHENNTSSIRPIKSIIPDAFKINILSGVIDKTLLIKYDLIKYFRMKYYLGKYLAITFCLTGALTELHAQQAISSSGGNAAGSGGIASYTIGQTLYSYNSGSEGSVSQGVQQPFEIYTLTAVNEAVENSINCFVFPNPVSSNLTLQVDFNALSDYKQLSYQLYDIRGNLLSNQAVLDSKSFIPMDNFNSGIYILKVTQSNNEIKTFKIIKY